MPPRKTPAGRAPQMLTLEEAGERLAVSHDSVQRLVTAGELAVVDVGTGAKRARLRVSEDVLIQFIKDRTIEASKAVG